MLIDDSGTNINVRKAYEVFRDELFPARNIGIFPDIQTSFFL